MTEPAAAVAVAPGTEPTPSEEELPRAFGKYTLLRKLATGGMAELFLALHRSVAGFEKLLVIKRILPSMNQDAGFIEMLLHEARIAATLDHPNIVQIFDVGKIDETYFIAMEHIHGEDIRSIVRAMKKAQVTEFPLEHTIGIVQGICAGLSYAHDKRDLDGRTIDIVHRDISPQNIVVTFAGDVKIVDFGIAKSGSQFQDDTKDGQLKGKVPYMSPEQANGDPIDWRSDIFATGVMLFELTTGKRLFKGQSEYETLKLICEREYPRPTQVRPGYPQALETIVMKALEKNRDERYQSAREMQADLEVFVREERLPVSTVAMSTWMQSLFVDKIAAQKEALQDVKQLADIIARQQDAAGAQSSLFEGTQSNTGSQRSAPGAATSIPAPAPKSSVGIWFVLAAVLAIGGGGFYSVSTREPRVVQGETQIVTVTKTTEVEAPKLRGTLEVKSDPEGCAIWINGDLQGQVTPAKLDNLPLDQEIRVKVSKEGLESHLETFTLSESEQTKAINAKLDTGSVTVDLVVFPVPTVWVDGKPWKGDRDKITGLSADEEHKIVLSAAGYVPQTVKILAKKGETKKIEMSLQKGDPNAAKAVDDTPKAPAGEPGTVRVGAKGGYCNVTINGAGRGPTPTQASVPSGTVRVTCTPPGGSPMSQVVNLKPGQVAPVFFTIP